MGFYTAEKYSWLSPLLGLVLVFVWGVLSLAHAYDRSLTRMNDSFTEGFMIVDRLGAVLDALSRLSVDQQAFLSTGDARFQDGVVESVEALTIHVETLKVLAARGKLQRQPLAILSRSIDLALNLVGESDEVRQSRGGRAALAYFDSRENTLAEARLQADQLRSEIARHISERVRSARSPKALLHDVVGGVSHGIRLEMAPRQFVFRVCPPIRATCD